MVAATDGRLPLRQELHKLGAAARSLLVWTEAVSQTLRGWPVVFAGGCVVGDVSVVSGVVSVVGAVSGPHGGYPVAVDLGEVVGHHQ